MSEVALPHTIGDRGFKRMEPFKCSYGTDVQVYESSAADEPHVWVSLLCNPRILHSQGPGQATAHLTLDQAAHLRDQLDWLIKNHYQEQAR